MKFEREPNYSNPDYDKNGELALFYNLAYNRINLLIAHFEDKPDKHTWELRNLFFEGDADMVENKLNQVLLKDETYLKLKLFVFRDVKGGDTYITQSEREIYNYLLLLLMRVRDFHSHYYHEDSGLYVYNDSAKKYLEGKFENAKQAYPIIERAGIKAFIVFDTNSKLKLTDQGINFFLSFFITKGVMTLFMNNRERLKDKGVKMEGTIFTDFNYHRHICSFYCLKDSHALHNAFLPKNSLDTINAKDYLALQIDNYLQTVPTNIYNELLEAEQENTAERRENKFMPLAATWLMLYKANEELQWRIWSPEQEKSDIAKNKGKSKEKKEIPQQRYSYIKKYDNTLTGDERIRISEQTVEIRLLVDSNKFAHIRLSERELMAWVYQTKQGKYPDALKKLTDFAKAYIQWIDALYSNDSIQFRHTDLLYPFYNAKHLLPQVLKNLNEQHGEAWQKAMHKDVIDKIEGNGNGQKGVLYWLKHEEPYQLGLTPTSIFSDTKAIRLLSVDADIEETKEAKTKRQALALQLKQAKGTRYKKMQVIQKCFRWLFGKKIRFTSTDDKNNFNRYCYLMDFPDYAKNDALIAGWKSKMYSRKSKKDNTNEAPAHYEQVLTLLANNTSFDSFYMKMIDYTINYLTQEVNKLKAGQYSENFLPVLARRLNVASKDLRNSTTIDCNRTNELLGIYRNKVDTNTLYYFMLPENFFKISFGINSYEKDWYKALRDNPNTYYGQQKGVWQHKKHMQPLQDTWQKVKAANAKDKPTIKALFKASIEIQQQLMQDTLLDELNKLAKPNVQAYKVKQNSFVRQVAGVSIICPLDTANDADNFIQKDRIEKMVLKIKALGKPEKQYTLKAIKEEIKKHWLVSRIFIGSLLAVEKHLQLQPTTKQFLPNLRQYVKQLNYIPFEQVCKQLFNDSSFSEEEITQLQKIRNKALHGDILDTNECYSDWIEKLKKIK
ncbi:MAG: hypothetical protein QM541_04765 [Flavobacterium sp.]|nr:hypothetical protein [Flavobacterium sp.]